MADDTMEISSDHGQNIDDDIDIDIDFTTGGVDEIGDEDYMVDEIPAQTGLDQSEITIDDVAMFDEAAIEEHKFDSESAIDMTISLEEDNNLVEHTESLEIPGAFMMVDDSTSLVPGFGDDENMLAADLLSDPVGDHLVQIAFDQDSTFDKVSGISTQGQEPESPKNSANSATHHTMSPKTASISPEQTSQSTDQPQDIMSGDQMNATEIVGSPKPQSILDASEAASVYELENAGNPMKEQPVNGVETTRNGVPDANEGEAQPSDAITRGENVGNDEHDDPAVASRKPSTGSLPQTLSTEVIDSQDNTASKDSTKDYPTVSGPEVVVAWQSNEYSLFPKSESDNPDSFFLADLGILERPLSEFLQSIRSIISEELQDEDELCMAVRDLGLEFEETSSHIHLYTLGQVIEVFHQLLVNDGQDIHSLYMNLNTRPNFTKRFGVCVAGVADGRGLSDFIIYGEEVESQDGLPEGDGDGENTELGNDKIESREPFDNVENLDEEAEEFDDEHITALPNLAPEEADISNTNADIEAEVQLHKQTLDHDASHDSVTDPPVAIVDEDVPGDEHEHEPEDRKSRDEEEDLIDYSDDELEAPKDQGNHQRSVSRSVNESTVLISEESSALEPDRRQEEVEAAKDRFAGEHDYDHGGSDDKSTAVKLENPSEVEEPSYEDESNLENPENLEENYESNEVNHVTHPDPLESGNNENDGLNDEEFSFFEGELDFGINQEGFELEAEPLVSNVDDAQELHASAVSDYDFVDTADSSATVSAGEPQQDENLGEYDDYNGEGEEVDLQNNNEDHSHDAKEYDTTTLGLETEAEHVEEDEIDYQELDTKSATLVKSQLEESPKNNGSSKRPISEVDVDELGASRDKDFKRSRS